MEIGVCFCDSAGRSRAPWISALFGNGANAVSIHAKRQRRPSLVLMTVNHGTPTLADSFLERFHHVIVFLITIARTFFSPFFFGRYFLAFGVAFF